MQSTSPARAYQIASAAILLIGVMWGFYWIPVRDLAQNGLTGGWGTAAITLAAMVVLAPLVLRRLPDLRQADPVAVISIALGGAAFTLYSIGFIYGRVALVVLLFYLTPVWSTLIARYMLGWDTPRIRILAMGVGLFGLLVMLGAKGDWPIPRNVGEWMGLASGLLWALSSTGIRVKPEIPPISAAFVFATGGCIASLFCIAILPETAPFTDLKPQTILIALLTGGFWWALSIPLLMWATARLEPARVGMLLMSEVLIGILSAAIIAKEHITTLESIGGLLVISAGLIEIWAIKAKTI